MLYYVSVLQLEGNEVSMKEWVKVNEWEMREKADNCTDDHRHCIMDVAATAAAASVFKPLVAADGERLHIAGLSETAAAAGPYL